METTRGEVIMLQITDIIRDIIMCTIVSVCVRNSQVSADTEKLFTLKT